MPRQSTALSQALLYLEILRLIPERSSISSTELQQALELAGIHIETLTLQRYLKALSESESLGVCCDKSSKPYSYRLEPGKSLSFFAPTAQVCLLVRLVEENLKDQLPKPLLTALEPLFQKARETLSETAKSTKERAWLKKVAVIPNSLRLIPPKVLPRIFNEVTDALYDESWVTLSYRDRRGNVKENFNFNPLAVVQQGERLYLVGHYEASNELRHLALHRIQDAKKTGVHAMRPAGFSLDRYLESSAFNYTADCATWIHLTFETTSSETVQQLTESPLARHQSISSVAPGRWTIDVPRIIDSMLLDQWFRTWEEKAQIENIRKTVLETKSARRF